MLFSCEYYRIFKNTYFEEHLQLLLQITLTVVPLHVKLLLANVSILHPVKNLSFSGVSRGHEIGQCPEMG